MEQWIHVTSGTTCRGADLDGTVDTCYFWYNVQTSWLGWYSGYMLLLVQRVDELTWMVQWIHVTSGTTCRGADLDGTMDTCYFWYNVQRS